MIPFFTRLKFAFKTFFALLFHGHIPDDVAATVGLAAHREPVPTPPAAVAPPVRVEPTAAQLLAVLQRDGRLIDFLMEDIAPYSDAHIGAAVREVHSGCRKAMSRYLTLTPVLDATEGARITIDRTTNPARVNVVGTAVAPFQGVVRHRGWNLNGGELPSLPSTDPSVIAPAEVEVA